MLDDVTLDVAPGEFVALLGPSGCGKSTLLRLIAGLELPCTGKVGADKVRIVGPDPSRLLVFQDPTLYPWRTVRQNVALGLEATGQAKGSEKRIDRVLDLVGLGDFAGALPNELSGGMAQRAALARVLVNNPRLLLLDEPLGKLDSLTRMTLQAELVRLWQDSRFTALLVTHDVEEALLLAQRIIIFSPRPAHVVREIHVDAAYPRHRDAPELQALRREILVSLGHDHEL
ncbi:ABC transporter ATP-binding protein [Sphingobium sp. H39-3-25]|uniref:ABC transporter ATP-binding protein n=1 Tax=Sphingobium arseniciresistens TaxID=3030834 RepID=UPI0023B92B64|nr:ABC transporter ATP-binding protein [Sphingobium arseniciresistens]